jgi:crotonobetainyl-CoA:carnitine CoA-transferase CaiB-like acyl-CoA transferase
MAGGVAGRDRSYYYSLMNRNKFGATLDLTTEAGRATFLDLVAVSDALIENFAAGTMQRLGLSYERLRRVNPGLVMVSLSGFGATGPAKDYIAYGPLLEAVSGMAALAGYAARPPTNSAYVYTDYLSGMCGGGLLLAGLLRRLETGQGAYFDLSQLEVSLNAIPDAVLAWCANRSLPRKKENRDEFAAIHGAFPCSGQDQWVALVVRTEEEWRDLCRAMGDPEWTREFASPVRRQARLLELERRIAEWTRQRTPAEAVQALQAQDVAAAEVNSVGAALAEPHLKERGAFQDNLHPVTGMQPAYASPINMSGVPRAIRRHAPLWGEHNGYLVRELLGCSPAEVERLAETGALR